MRIDGRGTNAGDAVRAGVTDNVIDMRRQGVVTERLRRLDEEFATEEPVHVSVSAE